MTTSESEFGRLALDRWRQWLGVSIGVHFGIFILYTGFICGCCFHALAAFVGVIPIFWAAFTIVACRTRGERILAAINLLLATGWLYLEWISNLQFLFWSYGARPS